MTAAVIAKERADEGRSTADRLLTGAAELFRRNGYSATTTRQLSAVLGIQNASLYYHMEKKEDLLYTLCVTTLADVQAVIEACLLEETDPLSRLMLIADRYTTTALRDRDRHATMLMEIRALSEGRRTEVIKARDRNLAIVRRAVAAAQKAGQVRQDIHAKYLTLAMFNLLNWSIFWYRPDGALAPAELARILTKVFFEGSLQRPTQRTPARASARDTRSSEGQSPTRKRRPRARRATPQRQ
jgi:AcrR family transcriptional regulator